MFDSPAGPGSASGAPNSARARAAGLGRQGPPRRPGPPPGGPGARAGGPQAGARARRVVAQEVRRLAHFARAVGEALACFAREERDPFLRRGLEALRGALEDRRALRRGPRVPGAPRGCGALDRGAYIGLARPAQRSDDASAAGGLGDRVFAHGARRGPCAVLGDAVLQACEDFRIGEIDAARIGALGIEVARQRHARIRDVGIRHLRDRVGDEPLERNRGVGDLVHERGVGAVLEHAAHQVGEQVPVVPDRRVDAAGKAGAPGGERLVERVAHAVELLELQVQPRARALQHERRGVAVVRRELREHAGARREQRLRAGHVGEIGRALAREHRVARQAEHLRVLHLGVPVGALRQAHHDAPPGVRGERGDPVAHRERALLVGLHREPEPVPSRERGLARQALEQLERQDQPVGLLGVDGERDCGARRGTAQPGEARQQLGEDAPALGGLEARVQRRELDRQSGARFERVGRSRGPADRGDRVVVGGEIALGVDRRSRRLAEHVVRIAQAGARLLERGGDRLAGDELPGHDLQGVADRGAHERISGARDQAAHHPLGGAFGRAPVDQAPGEHQRPRGRVDEQAGIARRVRPRVPGAAGELVADERVGGFRIGNAQQRLREAHQHHAFARRQAVAAQERFGAE